MAKIWTIDEILDDLLGDITPTGDHSRDMEILKNLLGYEDALGYIIRNLQKATKYYGFSRASIHAIACRARDILYHEGVNSDLLHF